ncbi:MAG: prepilin-type N-terminal cleavage/methylation domain-containing protein [archaeon]|jgi:hypothetical protein
MKSQKGFTLFTALISLLLVSISLALIFNMINTEETYLSLIQDQSSMSDLMTVGDIARADAFNTFLIVLRSQWELSKSKTSFNLTRKQMDQNWNYFVDSFVQDTFFEQNFASYFAQGLIFNLQYSENPPGYNITIEEHTGYEVGSNGDPTDIDDENTFENVVVKMFEDGGKKIDVIDCETDDNNCVGSFYLTLDTTQLSDVDYEILPVVTVLKYKSNQVIQRPVLSRQIYKIYMPWRGFQAFRVARNIAHSRDAERSDNPAVAESDTGLFNPEIHNTLEQARLGFCDPGTCAPRTDFFATPATTGIASQCQNIPDQTIATPTPAALSGVVFPPFGNYNLFDTSDPKSQFEKLYTAVLNENISSRIDPMTYNNGLVMQGDTVSDLNIFGVEVIMDKKRTKDVFGDAPGPAPASFSQTRFSELSDMSGVSGGLGLFLNSETQRSKMLWEMPGLFTWYNANTNLSPPIVATGEATGASYDLSCSEMDFAKIILQFIETDPRYRVRKQYQNLPVTINVVLEDRYTPFYFPPNGVWSELSVTGNNYLGPTSLGNVDFTGNAWKCQNYVAPGGGSPCTPPNE